MHWRRAAREWPPSAASMVHHDQAAATARRPLLLVTAPRRRGWAEIWLMVMRPSAPAPPRLHAGWLILAAGAHWREQPSRWRWRWRREMRAPFGPATRRAGKCIIASCETQPHSEGDGCTQLARCRAGMAGGRRQEHQHRIAGGQLAQREPITSRCAGSWPMWMRLPRFGPDQTGCTLIRGSGAAVQQGSSRPLIDGHRPPSKRSARAERCRCRNQLSPRASQRRPEFPGQPSAQHDRCTFTHANRSHSVLDLPRSRQAPGPGPFEIRSHQTSTPFGTARSCILRPTCAIWGSNPVSDGRQIQH